MPSSISTSSPSPHDIDRRKKRVAALSVASNSILMVGKLIVGLAIGSVSVISEAIHSGVDLLAALIAFFAVSKSGKPADPEHPFGHGKIENVSGTVEALLIFLAAGWILFEAIEKLIQGTPLEAPAAGFWIMLVSAVVNFGVSRLLFKVGRETQSVALQADAWHLATDVWTSLGVMAALGIIQLGLWLHASLGMPWLAQLHWLDPVMAIGVALLIIKAAWTLTLEAGRDLLDWAWPVAEQEWVRARVTRPRPGVRGIHKLRTRRGGATRFVDFHLIVDQDMTVERSHAITEEMTAEIVQRFPDTQVTIHVEPATPWRRVDPMPPLEPPPGARDE